MSDNSLLHSVERARQLLGGIGNRKFYQLLNSKRLFAVKLDGSTFVTDEEIKRFKKSLPEYVPAGEREAA